MEKMKSYKIDINGKTFKYQNVFHKKAGNNVLVGCSSLEKELVNEDGSYKGDYEQNIDERFYGYVNDDVFETMTYDEFCNYVNDNLD